MSTRVFNPYVMSGKRGGHFDFGGSGNHLPRDYASVERAKRMLFGPVDHAEAKMFAERELDALQEKASQKWNFDFKTGKPRTTPGDTGYKWVKLQLSEEIPKAYDLSGCEYLHLHADSWTTTTTTRNSDNGGKSSSPSTSSPSSSSSTSTVKQCNKQSMITDFMKATKRTSSSLSKSSSLSSSPSASPMESHGEPAPKKARARSS